MLSPRLNDMGLWKCKRHVVLNTRNDKARVCHERPPITNGALEVQATCRSEHNKRQSIRLSRERRDTTLSISILHVSKHTTATSSFLPRKKSLFKVSASIRRSSVCLPGKSSNFRDKIQLHPHITKTAEEKAVGPGQQSSWWFFISSLT